MEQSDENKLEVYVQAIQECNDEFDRSLFRMNVYAYPSELCLEVGDETSRICIHLDYKGFDEISDFIQKQKEIRVNKLIEYKSKPNQCTTCKFNTKPLAQCNLNKFANRYYNNHIECDKYEPYVEEYTVFPYTFRQVCSIAHEHNYRFISKYICDLTKTKIREHCTYYFIGDYIYSEDSNEIAHISYNEINGMWRIIE